MSWALRLLIGALCFPVICWSQVDLTRPLEVDADTVALYRMDDVATGQIADAAGGPAGDVLGGKPSLGKFGGALSFDGLKGVVDIKAPRNSATGTGLTVECWAKFRGGATGDIICRNHAYMMRIGGAIQAYLCIDGDWRKVFGGRPIPPGRWTHLAMTYDQATKEVRTYINGRLDVARKPEGLTEGKLDVGDDVLRLGSNTWAPERGMMDGKLDEVRISSVARKYTPLSRDPSRAIPADTNLIANPSFEFGLEGWRTTGEANTRLQWRLETGEAPHGKRFLRSTEERGYSIITRPITVVPGKVHTLSAMMRADKPTRVRLSLRCTGVPRKASRPGKSQSFEVTQEWQRISARFEIPEDWPTELACVQIDKPANVTLDVDAVSLVVGESGDYAQTEEQSVGLLTSMPQGNTFELGARASLPMQVVNAGDSDRQLRVDYRIGDWRGREVGRGMVFDGQVAGHGAADAKLDIPTDQVGWFTLRCSIRQDGRVLKETTRVFNVVEPMSGKGDVIASPLGMNTHMEREPNEHLACNLGALSRCGVKWIRGWWGWGMAEKEPGKFDWTEYDRQLALVQAVGMEIMPILLRYYPGYEHDWAGKTDKIQQPPYDMDQWGAFVETTVRRYRGRVKAWEVWNEPQYTMEADYYAKLLRVTYERIKAADPEALVVGFGGVSLDFIRKTFEAGSAKCMDVLSHHSYGQLSRPFELMAKLAGDTEALVKEFGATTRVWHSEQGTGADGVGHIHLGQSEEQCAVNLVQAYLSAFATGVEKFFWFSAQTSPSYGWAVFYEDYIPRPRLVALNGLARLLQGRRVVRRMELGGGEVACVLLEGDAGPAAALWNLASSVALELPADKGLALRDMLCNPIEAEAAERDFVARLERGRPVYVLVPGMSVAELRELLQRAALREMRVDFPLQASARKTEDGRLEVSVKNAGTASLDVRVRVAAPDLFARPPDARAIADLPPHEVWAIVLTPDRKPKAGAKVPVKVTLEVGAHGIREHVGKVSVAF